MIKHVWSLVCKESKIEQITNNISIIDVYESLQFDLRTEQNTEENKGKPIGVPVNFEIISLFYRDKKGTEEHFDEKIIVIDPKGVVLGEFAADVLFKDDQDRVRSIVKFNMIALTISGDYVFQVNLAKKGADKMDRVSSIPISIKVSVNGVEY